MLDNTRPGIYLDVLDNVRISRSAPKSQMLMDLGHGQFIMEILRGRIPTFSQNIFDSAWIMREAGCEHNSGCGQDADGPGFRRLFRIGAAQVRFFSASSLIDALTIALARGQDGSSPKFEFSYWRELEDGSVDRREVLEYVRTGRAPSAFPISLQNRVDTIRFLDDEIRASAYDNRALTAGVDLHSLVSRLQAYWRQTNNSRMIRAIDGAVKYGGHDRTTMRARIREAHALPEAKKRAEKLLHKLYSTIVARSLGAKVAHCGAVTIGDLRAFEYALRDSQTAALLGGSYALARTNHFTETLFDALSWDDLSRFLEDAHRAGLSQYEREAKQNHWLKTQTLENGTLMHRAKFVRRAANAVIPVGIAYLVAGTTQYAGLAPLSAMFASILLAPFVERIESDAAAKLVAEHARGLFSR